MSCLRTFQGYFNGYKRDGIPPPPTPHHIDLPRSSPLDLLDLSTWTAQWVNYSRGEPGVSRKAVCHQPGQRAMPCSDRRSAKEIGEGMVSQPCTLTGAPRATDHTQGSISMTSLEQRSVVLWITLESIDDLIGMFFINSNNSNEILNIL